MAQTVQAAGPQPPSLAGAVLRDAAIAGVVTFLLASQIVGIETIDNPAGLEFTTRYLEVLGAVVLVVLGRIAMHLIRIGKAPVALAGSLVVAIILILSLRFGEEIGFKLLPFTNEVIDWLAVVIALAFALRAALVMTGAARAESTREQRDAAMDRFAARTQRFTPWIGAGLVAAAILLPIVMPDRRIVDMGILVLTYCMLGWGLNVVVGYAGLLDLGYVAFYAVGAYSYALIAHYFGWSFWMALPFAGILSAFAGVLLGFPVLRLRGDYLAIVTLGFGEIIRVILINWWWFTGGPDGIRDIPRPSFFGLQFERNPASGIESFHTYFGIEFAPIQRIIFLYYVILLLALITCAFTLRLRKLPIGRAWEALREDETACRALGINPTNTKLTAFAIGAMLAGFAGSFFATRQGFISPESFTFVESAVILAIVVLGGLGSQVGVVLASVILIGLPEIFRELANFRMLAFGAGMVLIMVWRPRGLLAHREPTVFLRGRRQTGAE
jgi:branched-chain amino acid transport system permease protein